MFKKIFVLLLLLSFTLYANGFEYHVDKTKTNQVKFISDAPVENFEGVTSDIDGYLYYEDDDYSKESQIYFEVDLTTIDTGIGLRNRHMRENYLETDQFPMASYSGVIISATENSDGVIEIEAKGEFSIHGNSMEQNIKAVIKTTGDQIEITTQFIIKLSEYDIEVPSLMFMKINEEMDLRVNFHMNKAN